MDNLKTGVLIAETRKNLNLTQKDLAENLHVSIQAVSKWERGLIFPDVLLLEPLSELLGLSVSELLAGERKAQPQSQPQETPSEEHLVPEQLVQESIRLSTAQLGGKIRTWRQRFLLTAALLSAIFLLLGYFFLRENTKLFPQNKTALSYEALSSEEALATAVAFGGDIVLYQVTYADGITGESLQLELWTPEGLEQIWPLFSASGEEPAARPRRDTIGLSTHVEFGRDGSPDIFHYGAALQSGVVRGTIRDVPYLSAGFGSDFLTKRVEAHPEYGVVLACYYLDTTMQGRWTAVPCLGAAEHPEVPAGQAILLMRLMYEYE